MLGVGWVVWLRWLSRVCRRATGLSGRHSAASGSGLKVVPLHIFACAAMPAVHHRKVGSFLQLPENLYLSKALSGSRSILAQTLEKKSSNEMSVGNQSGTRVIIPPITPVFRGIDKSIRETSDH